jgi:hypothetical protein
MLLRTFAFPLIARSACECPLIPFLMQVVDSINDFFRFAQIASRHVLRVQDFRSIFPLSFVFAMLVSSVFIFPDDLMLLSFIFHSLRVEFIDGTHSKHFF